MQEKARPITPFSRTSYVSATREARPRWVPFVEIAGILTCSALWLTVASRLVNRQLAWSDLTYLIIATVLGIFLADAASGVAHWFCDTFFEETTPLIGPLMIAAFREHHRDPLAMTRHGFLELNGSNCLALTPVLATGWWLGAGETLTETAVFGHSVLLSFSFTVTATNQFHRWAHDPAPPWFARLLQRLGLALSPEHHSKHHAPPHRSAYCVTNGWVNGFADRFGVFSFAERILVAIGIPRNTAV